MNCCRFCHEWVKGDVQLMILISLRTVKLRVSVVAAVVCCAPKYKQYTLLWGKKIKAEHLYLLLVNQSGNPHCQVVEGYGFRARDSPDSHYL